MGFQNQSSNRPRGRYLPNPKLKFLEQCREVMRFKQFSRRTEETYLQWIRRFIVFHRKIKNSELEDEKNGSRGRSPHQVQGWIWRHPKDMGEPEVRAFLTNLAVKRGVVAATQNQALNALLFLYREVLGGEMAWVDGFERAKRSQRVPMVLSQDEVRRLLGQLRHPTFNRAGIVWDGIAVDGVSEVTSSPEITEYAGLLLCVCPALN